MYVPHFINPGCCNANVNSCGCGTTRSCCNTGGSCSRVIVGPPGPPGPAGAVGPMGLPGIQGPQGIPGGVIGYADFYALMPPDNATAIAAGGDVAFPRTNTTSASGITSVSTTSFNLANAGTYLVMFDVYSQDAGQLVLTANGTELPYTAVGTSSADSDISGMTLLTTTAANTVITVRNPSESANSITPQTSTGGELATTAHLIIIRIA